jgi:hypothetical protein
MIKDYAVGKIISNINKKKEKKKKKEWDIYLL